MDQQPHETNWFLDQLERIGPELIGGFFGYFLHEIQHKLFRRPGRALLGAMFRRRG